MEGNMTKLLLLVSVAVSLLATVEARPQGGMLRDLTLTVNKDQKECPQKCSHHCANLIMTSKSPITITINSVTDSKTEADDSQREETATKVKLFTVIYTSRCAKVKDQMCTSDSDFFDMTTALGWNNSTLTTSTSKQTIKFEDFHPDVPEQFTRLYSVRDIRGDEEGNSVANMSVTKPYTYMTNTSTVYVVLLAATYTGEPPGDNVYTVSVTVDMRNSYGYLSLIDYPALIVYSLLLVAYVILGFAWLIMLGCYYKDLVQLQFWILAVIILGFLEKVFFVAEYSTVNEGQNSWGLIYVAEFVSAAKRALSRMLLIIVCEGFGTVKPRLGNTLHSVVGIGVVYFVVAFVDGVVRAINLTTHSQDLLPLLVMGVLILVDCGVFYWIFSALVNTRRQLRLRKNYVKISLYNHLAYALVFAVIASLAFLIWWFIELSSNKCVKDWKEVWLKECFWHMLFVLVLIAIIIIWRPSANNKRFAYSLVMNNDEDEDDEQGPNKNFENLKMRTVPKSDVTKPAIPAETEEDLKWVEENLPTTTLDKGISLVMDSEEEDMTTMFEMSKKN